MARVRTWSFHGAGFVFVLLFSSSFFPLCFSFLVFSGKDLASEPELLRFRNH